MDEWSMEAVWVLVMVAMSERLWDLSLEIHLEIPLWGRELWDAAMDLGKDRGILHIRLPSSHQSSHLKRMNTSRYRL